MEDDRLETNKYVAKVFRERLDEMGVTMYRFVNSVGAELANKPTLSRLLNGKGNTNLDTVVKYADWLGLEVVIRPKVSAEEAAERIGLLEVRRKRDNSLNKIKDNKWK